MADTLMRRITITPEAYGLLARPVVGQGGYQDRLRRIQKALNIDPIDGLDAVSPSRVKLPENFGRQAMNGNRVDDLATVIKGLQQQIASLQQQIAAGHPVEETDDDSDVDVTDLQAVLAKAQAARQEKAALRAAGRKRRSPRLSDEEREKRSRRMKSMWRKARKASK